MVVEPHRRERVCPLPLAAAVLERRGDPVAVVLEVSDAKLDLPDGTPFPALPPLEVRAPALQDHLTLGSEVPSAALEKAPTAGRVRPVDEIAGEQHHRERPSEIEGLDLRQHPFCLRRHVLEHGGRAVDARDGVSELEQPPRHPAGAASKLEDLGAGGNVTVNDLGLTEVAKQKVEPDERLVTGPSHVAILPALTLGHGGAI